MIILKIILYLLLALLLILLMLLIIPVEYSSNGYKYETYMVDAELSWLLGGLRFRVEKESGRKLSKTFRLFGSNILKGNRGNNDEKIDKARKEEKQKSGRKALNSEFFKKVFETSGELLRHIKPAVLEVKGRFGFDDPCDTAMVWLLVSNVRIHGEGASINIYPVFDDEVFEGSYKIQGRVVLIVVLWIALKFILSGPVRNILKKERKSKVYAN